MEKTDKPSCLGFSSQNPKKTGGYFSSFGSGTKNLLCSSEIEGNAIKELLGDVSDMVLPLARQYRMSREVESEKGKSPGRLSFFSELREYGRYLRTHPKDMVINTAAIITGIPAVSTVYVLSNPEIRGELLRRGKIWNDVSFFPPSQGNTQSGMDYHQPGNRNPHGWDTLCLATIPIEIILATYEGVRYYNYRRKQQEEYGKYQMKVGSSAKLSNRKSLTSIRK